MKTLTLLALLATTLTILTAVHYASAQQQEPVSALSYRAFSGLATVYQQGGDSSQLVAELNQALSLLDEAQVKVTQGDSAAASNLQAQASAILTGILQQTPSAQRNATAEQTERIWATIALIPLVVLFSTVLFYIALSTWRRYEKSILYKMRIIRAASDENLKD